jgi:hypothetical protein
MSFEALKFLNCKWQPLIYPPDSENNDDDKDNNSDPGGVSDNRLDDDNDIYFVNIIGLYEQAGYDVMEDHAVNSNLYQDIVNNVAYPMPAAMEDPD